MPAPAALWQSRAMIRAALLLGTTLALATGTGRADSPRVEAASAHRDAGGTWTVSVTLRHADSGWDHYANGWRLLAPDGRVLGKRDLTHPHVDEQPFTRDLTGIVLPAGLKEILIQPRCTMDGWVGMPTVLVLPAP